MTNAELAAERLRFATVMKSRRGDKDLLDLFHKLVFSDKFTEDAKPYCYADLVVEAARRVSKDNLPLLQETLVARTVAKKIWTSVPEPIAEAAMVAVVARLFAEAPRVTAPLLQLFLWSEQAGVATDRGHTMCLALAGGISMADMDKIHDLTFYEYYPAIPRPPELAAA